MRTCRSVDTSDGRLDELTRQALERRPEFKRLSRQQRHDIIREQAFLIEVTGERALQALTSLLPSANERREAIEVVDRLLHAATVTFEAVTTDTLRLEIQLRQGYSAGVLEWSID